MSRGVGSTPEFSAEDRVWMRRALRLAARGFTTPNPMVGCVVVKRGRLVGEGYHRLGGMAHAEVEALSTAGEEARGATAYITLEPCAHFGRTPPCTQALIAAGLKSVVAACQDPNPLVSGKGIAELSKAGIEVRMGLLEDEAHRLNREYFHFQATGRPFVTLKAAVTLDGKIATRTGDSKWVTGHEALRLAHRLRARSGAVLCGIGTVLADDPQLTARFRGVPRQPLRVVLDTQLKLPLNSKIACSARDVPTLVFAGQSADSSRQRNLEGLGLEIERLPNDSEGRIVIDSVLSELGGRGISSLLVEGGGAVHASFLAAGRVDRMLWFVAPKILGGKEAPTSVEGMGFSLMDQAIPLQPFTIRRLGDDLLLETAPQRILNR